MDPTNSNLIAQGRKLFCAKKLENIQAQNKRLQIPLYQAGKQDLDTRIDIMRHRGNSSYNMSEHRFTGGLGQELPFDKQRAIECDYIIHNLIPKVIQDIFGEHPDVSTVQAATAYLQDRCKDKGKKSAKMRFEKTILEICERRLQLKVSKEEFLSPTQKEIADLQKKKKANQNQIDEHKQTIINKTPGQRSLKDIKQKFNEAKKGLPNATNLPFPEQDLVNNFQYKLDCWIEACKGEGDFAYVSTSDGSIFNIETNDQSPQWVVNLKNAMGNQAFRALKAIMGIYTLIDGLEKENIVINKQIKNLQNPAPVPVKPQPAPTPVVIVPQPPVKKEQPAQNRVVIVPQPPVEKQQPAQPPVDLAKKQEQKIAPQLEPDNQKYLYKMGFAASILTGVGIGVTLFQASFFVVTAGAGFGALIAVIAIICHRTLVAGQAKGI